MKINLAALLIVSVLALAGCTQSPPQRTPAPHGGKPAPAPQALPAPPPPRPAPAAQHPRAEAASWRDLPQSPGSWTYAAEANGSAVSFSQPGTGTPPPLVLRCDRARPAIEVLRSGLGSGSVPATITTSSTLRRLTATSANPQGTATNAAPAFEITFGVRDPLLDAIAFSRGRFMVEVAGTQTLVLPVWSELGRVIEDCR